MFIDSANISVVVQGAIDKKLTPICLKSIRKTLPNAQIILSTWVGSDIDGLDYDILVLNEDPGAVIIDSVNKTRNNVNRQIISTKNGILKSDRQYILKIRSDIKLTGTGFLEYYDKYHTRSKDYKLFSQRIVVNNLYCANPKKTGLLYHLSDWVSFGLKSDMLDLWDIPLQDEKEQLFYKTHKRPIDFPNDNWYMRYIPEQYIMTSWLKKNGVNVGIKHAGDKNSIDYIISEHVFANNFVIVNYESFGIKFLKFNPYMFDYDVQYNHLDWQEMYKKYCDDDFIIMQDYKLKIKKHWKNFLQPLKVSFRWFSELFSVIYYCFKYVLGKKC